MFSDSPIIRKHTCDLTFKVFINSSSRAISKMNLSYIPSNGLNVILPSTLVHPFTQKYRWIPSIFKTFDLNHQKILRSQGGRSVTQMLTRHFLSRHRGKGGLAARFQKLWRPGLVYCGCRMKITVQQRTTPPEKWKLNSPVCLCWRQWLFVTRPSYSCLWYCTIFLSIYGTNW